MGTVNLSWLSAVACLLLAIDAALAAGADAYRFGASGGWLVATDTRSVALVGGGTSN